MGFKIKIPATSSKDPQYIPGLGSYEPGKQFVITDLQAQQFEASRGVKVTDVEGWEVSAVKDPKPPKVEEAGEAATEEEGDK